MASAPLASITANNTGLANFVTIVKKDFIPKDDFNSDKISVQIDSKSLSGVLIHAEFYNEGSSFHFQSAVLDQHKHELRKLI